MLFTFFYLTLLVLINDTIVFGFSPLTLALCAYFITLVFKRKNFTYNTNIKFIFSNVALQLWLLLSTSIQFLYKYISTVRVLKWKPLFKKSSYFGIYRSTRNQFLNK